MLAEVKRKVHEQPPQEEQKVEEPSLSMLALVKNGSQGCVGGDSSTKPVFESPRATTVQPMSATESNAGTSRGHVSSH